MSAWAVVTQSLVLHIEHVLLIQVQVGDQVVFESMKSTNQFLHTSNKCYGQDTVYTGL